MRCTSISVVRTLLQFVRVHSWGLVLGMLAACGGVAQPKLARDDPGFYDFTTASVSSLAEFEQLAAAATTAGDRPAIAAAKFVITSFSEPSQRRIRFLDGRHYQFHDEWAWFRLLNGQGVSGMAPLELHRSAAPEDARIWARAHEGDLPDGLEITDGRLYVRHFYDLSLADQKRRLGAGSLIHVEARAGHPELWGFEVDYADPARVEELLVFFSMLESAIPAAAAAHLAWFARSPEQLATGRELMVQAPRLEGRVLTYADVSIPGQTEVYTAGIVAGRLRAFRELSRLADAEPEDILLLGALPEYLPQARGLVTSIPQTPLAHLNLLAKSRQIVNAYRGGVLEDPEVQDLLRSRAPVVLSTEDGALRFHRLTEPQYQSWQASLSSAPPLMAAVNASEAPYIVDLAEVKAAELPGLGPLIGGKALGMVHLLRGLGPGSAINGVGTLRADVPDRPLAVTIRAYREHVAPLLPELRALLADPTFIEFKKLRWLALEGAKDFMRKFPGKRDRELALSYQNPRAAGPIAAMVRRGGVRHEVRHAPLPKAFEAELERVLRDHFGAYSAEQGLRFRSSSNVEDIEGFNGAGLYDSATGYLFPRKGFGKAAKQPSVADALRQTWASYFSAEAFEERQQNHIEHLAADMAVLVHARFDDAFEQANGVFTFSLAPGQRELSVDAQPGAVSVTNPPTDRVVIPESTLVTSRGAAPKIQRQSLSSVMKAGQFVLNDTELFELFRLAEALTERHLEADNTGILPAQQRRSLVMDFEFRRVSAGWPALTRGQRPARFVVKQMRPLEPSPRVSAELRTSPIPHDVLSRARRIESELCRGPGVELSTLEVWTDPDALPDLGYSRTPLLAGLGVTFRRVPARVFTHLEQRAAQVAQDGWAVELKPGFPFARVEVHAGVATLTPVQGKPERVPVRCERELAYAEPRELLRSFLKSSQSK